MNNKDNKEDDDDEGSGGSGSFGSPKLKPNLEQLFDPQSVIHPHKAHALSTSQEVPQGFGCWQYHPQQLMLYNYKLHKKLMLEALDTPTKLLKVIVGLGVQQGWDTENLIKTLDLASNHNFNKPLYNLISQTKDTVVIQWKEGTLHEVTNKPNTIAVVNHK